MFQYIITHAFPPLTSHQRYTITVEACEAMLHVSECRVVSRSLIGNYVYRSLIKETKVVVATWVTFENKDCAPWLVLLLRPKVLVLCAPDGTQIEVSLPFHVDCVWPVSLNGKGMEGLIFQRVHATTISDHISVFSMIHPLHDLHPVGEFDCIVNNGYSAKLSHDTSERIIFVSRNVPRLVVTYNILRKRHALWYLYVRGASTGVVDPELHKHDDTSSVFLRDMSSEHFFARMPELLTGRVRVSSRSKALNNSSAAFRVFCAGKKDGSLLCLVLAGSSSLETISNCTSVFIIMKLNCCKYVWKDCTCSG